MVKPTHVASYISNASGINSTLPQTMSVTTAIGDRLVAWASMADNAATVSTPTGGTGLTWALSVRDSNAASFSGSYLWTAGPATAAETFTLQTTKTGGSGTFMWAFGCERWSGASGFGTGVTASSSSGAPSVNVTTTKANSAIVVVDSDWNAGATTGKAWRTGAGALTELLVDQDTTSSSTLTCYIGYYADAAAAGTYAVGLTAPSTQKYTIVAVEVFGIVAVTQPVNRARLIRASAW